MFQVLLTAIVIAEERTLTPPPFVAGNKFT